MPTRRHILPATLVLVAARPATASGPPAEAAALLPAWAAAYATNDGARCAALYTDDARLWGSVSRAQTVGRAAITAYFGRTRPDATAIGVRFDDVALRQISAEVAVASGRYTFLRTRADGTVTDEPSRYSMTLVRGADGAWRIADHHSSRLPPAAPG